MIKTIITSSVLAILLVATSYADNSINSVASNWFTKFSAKTEQKLKTKEQKITFYENFSKKIEELLDKKDFTSQQVDLIGDIKTLSDLRIQKLQEKEVDINSLLKSRLKDKYLKENNIKPDNVSSGGKKVQSNEEYEKQFKLLLESKEKKNKELIEKNKELTGFKHYLYNDDFIIQEDGVWYTIIFDQFLTFEDWESLRERDLLFNGINPKESIIFMQKNNPNAGFITDYKKVKLISDSIIYGIPNKYNFIKEIKDDKKSIINETDNIFIELKNKSIELTKGKTDEEKIKILYNYILENVKYSENFSYDDYKVYSGIQTYLNKDGVCEGYVKIFLYMASFAGIENVETIRGYVLDAPDFPEIGHAWLKIEDKYYDITFDDPVGQTETIKEKDYVYFKLPKDLFYTNRYDMGELSKEIKTKSKDELNAIILKNIYPLIEKYKDNGYNVLKPYLFKIEYDIKLAKKLNIERLKKVIPYYEVDNFKFNKDGKIIHIKNLSYFKIDDSQVEVLAKQLNYDFAGYYLFKWKLEDGTYEYRASYNVELK